MIQVNGAVAAAVLKLALCPEALAGRAVPALVGALVDVALVVHLHEYFLHALYVARLGGADEVIVGDLHSLPQFLYARDDTVDVFLRRDPLNCLTYFLSTILDF